ncbi:transmembrane protein-like [Tropilaelaps mercedesae]|uniref:GDT1 family protein n=1 Tax=Tropilaelaps mercedesae TaxID=418985 RepID=A0A1V9X335_9ACAR|nr:transmembrane protein-like [Tropilaelaps mercedesae]
MNALIVAALIFIAIAPLCASELINSNNSVGRTPPAMLLNKQIGGDIYNGVSPTRSTTYDMGSGAPKTCRSSHFWQGFLSALSVVLVSEIGDKTFFIAAIMSMRHQATVVFAGALSALIVMTILSGLMGSLSRLVPREYMHYASIVLFIVFGLKMLYDAWRMSDNEAKESFKEVEQQLNDKEIDTSVNSEISMSRSMQTRTCAVMSRVFWQALVMTFIAEWGDRSQLSTILLATREDVWAVNTGAIAGHSMCTLLAVAAGSIVAKRVSVKTLTFVGGVVFLLFAAWVFFVGPDEEKPVTL